MPLYEYKCPKCDKEWEESRPIHKRDLVSCPECGCLAERTISKISFELKGQGWASNGYGSWRKSERTLEEERKKK